MTSTAFDAGAPPVVEEPKHSAKVVHQAGAGKGGGSAAANMVTSASLPQAMWIVPTILGVVQGLALPVCRLFLSLIFHRLFQLPIPQDNAFVADIMLPSWTFNDCLVAALVSYSYLSVQTGVARLMLFMWAEQSAVQTRMRVVASALLHGGTLPQDVDVDYLLGVGAERCRMWWTNGYYYTVADAVRFSASLVALFIIDYRTALVVGGLLAFASAARALLNATYLASRWRQLEDQISKWSARVRDVAMGHVVVLVSNMHEAEVAELRARSTSLIVGSKWLGAAIGFRSAFSWMATLLIGVLPLVLLKHVLTNPREEVFTYYFFLSLLNDMQLAYDSILQRSDWHDEYVAVQRAVTKLEESAKKEGTRLDSVMLESVVVEGVGAATSPPTPPKPQGGTEVAVRSPVPSVPTASNAGKRAQRSSSFRQLQRIATSTRGGFAVSTPPSFRDSSWANGTYQASALTASNLTVGYAPTGAATEPVAVLSNVSFTIPAGSVVGIVGETGSGKTTLLRTLTGLLPPLGGHIHAGDGPGPSSRRDIYAHDITQWWRSICVVPQGAHLFERSVRDNIVYGMADVPEESVVAAAKEALAWDFIQQLPGGQGLDTTMVGGGEELSGGQRQRLHLARAFVRRAGWLVLDEPMAALDGRTQASVAANLRASLARRKVRPTMIIVTHRESMLGMCDMVLEVRDGTVTVQRSHEQGSGGSASDGVREVLCPRFDDEGSSDGNQSASSR